MRFTRAYWSDDSKTQKQGRAQVRLKAAWVKWMGKNWIDFRAFRRTDDGYEATKQGIRLSPAQLREMLPHLVEMLDHITEAEEEARRKEGVTDGEPE